MRFPSNRVLAKIIVYGTIGGVSAMTIATLIARRKFQQEIRDADYFKEAFRILRTNSAAIKLIGEPIKECGFDLKDTSKNFCNGKLAQFEVDFKGPITSGTMFFWAENNTEVWDVNRIELELKSHPDRRLLIKGIKSI